METQLSVVSAVYGRRNPDFVNLVFNDNTRTGIYINDGSQPTVIHEMLNAWLAKGNEIAES